MLYATVAKVGVTIELLPYRVYGVTKLNLALPTSSG